MLRHLIVCVCVCVCVYIYIYIYILSYKEVIVQIIFFYILQIESRKK